MNGLSCAANSDRQTQLELAARRPKNRKEVGGQEMPRKRDRAKEILMAVPRSAVMEWKRYGTARLKQAAQHGVGGHRRTVRQLREDCAPSKRRNGWRRTKKAAGSF